MLNRVQLIGNLGKDPETKNFPNGGSMTTFAIATSENWVDKNTGERREHTEWHNIVLQNRLAEIAQQYLRKGAKVYLEGSLRTRRWTDQGGIERYTTEIRCDQMKMLDRNQSNDHGDSYPAQQGNQGGYGKPQQNAPQGGGYGKPQQNAPQGGGYGPQPTDLEKDDLPF